MNDSSPPVAKYRLTVEIRGNSHEELEGELLGLTRGGYLLASDYHQLDAFESIGGRDTIKLEHTNPDMTPERYREELDAWFQARRAAKRVEGQDS